MLLTLYSLGLILQELASHGHHATLIPVLSFKFVSLNMLTDKVSALKLFLFLIWSKQWFLLNVNLFASSSNLINTVV